MKYFRRLTTQIFDCGFKKYILIMKLTALLCLISLLPISASVYSQNSAISLKIEDKNIQEILEQIEQKTQFHFLYNVNFIDLNKKMNIDVEKMNISDLLTLLFKGSSSSFKILNNNLVIVAPVEIMQQQKFAGAVTDATSGEAIVGANIVIEGTNIRGLQCFYL